MTLGATKHSEVEGAKPFLRWAGSKQKIVERLRVYWQPYHCRYIEPFAGSACLFFYVMPSAAVIGDNNRELVDLYRIVQSHADELYRRLAHIPRTSHAYYRWRSINPSGLDSVTRALRFLYLNRNCFNGIYRTNKSGTFNVPYGAKEGKPIGGMDKANFLRCADQLSRAELIYGDFAATLAPVEKNDFVYMDPPFAVSARRVFSQYGEKTFATQDVPRLAKELRRLHKIGAQFLVSYADCAEARTLATEWNATRLSVRRNIAGFSGDRRNASEWLISNMDAVQVV